MVQFDINCVIGVYRLHLSFNTSIPSISRTVRQNQWLDIVYILALRRTPDLWLLEVGLVSKIKGPMANAIVFYKNWK